MGWQERWEGRACGRCDARRDLLVVIHCHPPGIDAWATSYPWRYLSHAHCFDTEACRARVVKLQKRARQRGGMLVLEAPQVPEAPRGKCRWCGKTLHRSDGAVDKRRNYCYLDREGRDCVGEWNKSRTWDARVAVRHRARADYGLVACVDCGTVCEGADQKAVVAWEADHEIPLEDGGEHALENLCCRCVPCHKAKTGREATARAEARRAHVFSASKVGPFMDAMRDPTTAVSVP